MRIAVVGSRNWPAPLMVDDVLDMFPKEDLTIVSGGARGVDTQAKNYAKKFNLGYKEHLPQWKDRFGNFNSQAGKERNTLIIEDNIDLVLAFQYKNSGGTQDSIDKACKLNIPVLVYK